MPLEVVARLSNLPCSITEDHLRELIEPFAKVRRIVMPTPLFWHTCPTGRAEVVGDTTEDTKLVYVHLHGTVIDGNRVNVFFAKLVDDAALVPPPRAPLDNRERARRLRSTSEERWRDRRPRRGSPEPRYAKKHERRRSRRRSSSPRKRRRHSRSSSRRSSSFRRRTHSSSRGQSRSRSPSWEN